MKETSIELCHPFVTVIIPVYNAGKLLSCCLDSLAQQTFKDFEVICVDDGSTDDAFSFLEGNAAVQSLTLKILRQANLGTLIARKTGVAQARGQYLAFIDPDDSVEPNYLQKLVQAAQEGDWDIVQCGVKIIETRERTEAQRAVSERYFNPDAPTLTNGELLTQAYIQKHIGWNLIFRFFRTSLVKEAFLGIPDVYQINGTDAAAFFPIAARARSFCRISDRLYRYRYGDGISTRLNYTLADYKRTLGKFDFARGFAPFVKGDEAETAFVTIVSLMVMNSRKSAYARLAQNGETVEGLKILNEALSLPSRPIHHIGIHYYNLHIGGVQRVLVETLSLLRKLGFQVTLFLEDTPEPNDFSIPEGVRCVSFPRSCGNVLPPEKRIPQVVSCLRDSGIDAWYDHAIFAPAFFQDVVIAKFLVGIPVLAHYHTVFTAPLYFKQHPEYFELQSFWLCLADVVFTLSRIDACYFQSQGLNAVVLPNAVSSVCREAVQRVLPTPKRPRILWCGRISWEKCPQDASKIVALVKKVLPQVEFDFVSGVRNPYPHFAAASVFLSTSKIEGFSLTSLEALSHGLPVVAYQLENLDIYRDNPAVIQVPQGDIEAAAQAIIQVLTGSRFEALREKARESVKPLLDFNHADIWHQIHDTGLCLPVTSYLCCQDAMNNMLKSANQQCKQVSKFEDYNFKHLRHCLNDFLSLSFSNNLPIRPNAFEVYCKTFNNPLDLLKSLAMEYSNQPRELALLLEDNKIAISPSPRKIRTIGIYYYHLTMGGVQRVIALQIFQFLKMGYRVVLFVEDINASRHFELPKEVEVVPYPCSRGKDAVQPNDRIERIVQILNEHPVDVFYSHAYISPFLLWDSLAIRMVCRVPFILHYHSMFTAPFYASNEVVYNRFFEAIPQHRLCDMVVTLSRVDLAYERLNGVHAVYLPNPADPMLAPISLREIPSRPLIIWVGRIDELKCPLDALRIFAKVREKFPSVRFRMIGNGAEWLMKRIRQLAEELNLGESFELPGGKSDVYPDYLEASLCLSTSRIEGFPMVSFEALAHGLPIVAYRLPHVELYRDNVAVVQVPQRDIESAAEAIGQMLKDPSRLEQLRKSAVDSVQAYLNYDFVKVWKAILGTLENKGPMPLQEVSDEDQKIMMETCYTGIMQLQSRIGSLRLLLTDRDKILQNNKAKLDSADEAIKVLGQELKKVQGKRQEQCVELEDKCKQARKALSDITIFKNGALTKETQLQKQLKSSREEIKRLKGSEAYRVGMFVTWPARRIYRMMKCYRENGFKYTLRRLVLGKKRSR